MQKWILTLAEWLKRVVTQPRDELTRWQMTVRYGYDLSRYGARQLRQDRAAQMAAALAFRTLFGLIPVLVLGTMLVRAFGGSEQFHTMASGFLSALGADVVQVATAEDGTASQSLSEWVLDLLGRVENINLAAITWVGVGVLIYSAVSLMVTIEGCFNSVCRAPEGRAWTRRVPIYWTVLTLAPAAIAFTTFVDNRFDAFIAEAISWRWALRVTPVVWSLVATWLVMFVIYKLLPNTSVHSRPAFIGAFVAAVLLEVGKRTLNAYLDNALSIQQLYGSLGLLPLFMLWVYLMWLVVLFGLEVTATVQMLSGRKIEEIEHRRRSTGLIDPASVLSVMGVVAERFGHSAATTAAQVAEITGIEESTVQVLLRRLIETGLLHRLDQEELTVSLARPPDGINASELIEVGFALVDESSLGQRTPFVRRLREAQRAVAAQATLAALAATTTADQVETS